MTEQPAATEALLRALDEKFVSRRAEAARTDVPESSAWPFLAAAAVLHVFDPTTLHPAGPAGSSADPAGSSADPAGGVADPAALVRHSVPAVGWRQEGLRSLRIEDRREALRRLGSPEAMTAALAPNPDRVISGPQKHFEKWLDGGPFPLDRMAYVELEDLSNLYDWGLDAFGGLPPSGLVERALAQRSAVAVFEHLVDRDFVGRLAELRVLHDHLHAGASPDVLSIEGPGGAGKTALVGKFLIDHVEAAGQTWFPFAYLPFDSETLDVREPFTLLLDIVGQLSTQSGPAGDTRSFGSELLDQRLDAFREFVAGYRDHRGSLQRRASQFAVRGERIHSLSGAEEGLYGVFADVLAAASAAAGDRPVLLVFDTFEEVVYRATEDLIGFWSMLAFLKDRIAPLRVIIAGRGRPAESPFSGVRISRLVLGDLEEPDAVLLLNRLGLTDPATALAVARQVGGNPMSLRLAASVARTEPPDGHGLSGIATDAMGAEIIRGQLYRRLLDHIHDDRVRALAHPGMVLRRVTAVIIEEVLAPVCGLGDVHDGGAQELFEALRREQVLVSFEGDGSLRYREEVRRPVLELLARDRPGQVRRIHRAAVDFYRRSDTPADRAEELYHRMMLRQSARELDGRWLGGVERYLASAIDELPAAQRRWLAGRMSIELPPEAYRRADVEEWERLIGRKAVEVVRYGGPERVLALLAERPDRTHESPLPAIEARALLDLLRPVDAAALLDRALARYPAMGNPGRLAELYWLRSQAAVATGDADGCLGFLRRLVVVAQALGSSLALTQALTEILGVRNPRTADEMPELAGDRQALSHALDRLTEAEVVRERSLVRLALVRLGPNYPLLVAKLAPQTAFDLVFLSDQREIDLAPAIGPVLDRVAVELPALRGVVGDPARPDIRALVDALVAALSMRAKPEPDERRSVAPLAEAMRTLMRVEQATLSGSALAGIDDYREPWELDVTLEVA